MSDPITVKREELGKEAEKIGSLVEELARCRKEEERKRVVVELDVVFERFADIFEGMVDFLETEELKVYEAYFDAVFATVTEAQKSACNPRSVVTPPPREPKKFPMLPALPAEELAAPPSPKVNAKPMSDDVASLVPLPREYPEEECDSDVASQSTRDTVSRNDNNDDDNENDNDDDDDNDNNADDNDNENDNGDSDDDDRDDDSRMKGVSASETDCDGESERSRRNSGPDGSTRMPVAREQVQQQLHTEWSPPWVSLSKRVKTVLWRNDTAAKYRLEAQLRRISVKDDRSVTSVTHRKHCRKRHGKFSMHATGKDTLAPCEVWGTTMDAINEAVAPAGAKDCSASPCDPGG